MVFKSEFLRGHKHYIVGVATNGMGQVFLQFGSANHRQLIYKCFKCTYTWKQVTFYGEFDPGSG